MLKAWKRWEEGPNVFPWLNLLHLAQAVGLGVLVQIAMTHLPELIFLRTFRGLAEGWLFVGNVEQLVVDVALGAVLQHKRLGFRGVHCTVHCFKHFCLGTSIHNQRYRSSQSIVRRDMNRATGAWVICTMNGEELSHFETVLRDTITSGYGNPFVFVRLGKLTWPLVDTVRPPLCCYLCIKLDSTLSWRPLPTTL